MNSTHPASPPSVPWQQPAGWWRVRGASSNALRLGAGLAPEKPLRADVDEAGHTLWHYWAEGAQGLSHFEQLREHKDLGNEAYLNRRSQGGEHPLHRLLLRGQLQAARKWIEVFGPADFSMRNEHGDDLLLAACWSGCTAAVSWLLSIGAEPAQADQQGRNALIVALHRCGLDTATELVMAGADPSHCDHQGRSAMHHAASVALVDLLPTLEDAGGDMEARDSNGASAAAILDRTLRSEAASVLAAKTYWLRRYQDRLAF